MAKAPTLSLFFLLLVAASTAAAGDSSAAAASPYGSHSTSFIVEKCSETLYAALCVRSLSAYAAKIQRSQRLLAQAALFLSLQHAQSCRVFIYRLGRVPGLRPREAAALRDCAQVIDDTVSRLNDSTRELQQAGQTRFEEFQWHMSNVQTWVSAAITDDTTCMDGFGGQAMDGKIKTMVHTQVLVIVHYTSNALALVNQYANQAP
ncbi:hypothetical protein Dimus_000431 [Dionaea muscipula]